VVPEVEQAPPKRGYSFDLPSDGSMAITEDQLTALGSIRLHLWKSLRFKLQKFFVANVTNPQVGYFSLNYGSVKRIIDSIS
jgi:hypothetical protein